MKRPESEADRSPLSIAEVKKAQSYTRISNPSYIFIALCLIKHNNNFMFLQKAFTNCIYQTNVTECLEFRKIPQIYYG
jgi:hypothetical protein